MKASIVEEKKGVRATLIQAITMALREEMERDDNVIVLGEDVGKNGGVFRATDGLFDKFGQDRVIDTPLAESAIIGASLGLCVAGFRPVAEIQFAGFVYPGLNQLFSHVSRYRNRSRGAYSAPMVIRMPSGGGIHAPEHHSESYESLFVNTPGLKVVMPSNPYDAKGLLKSSIRDDDPVVFMEPIKIYRSFREEIPEDDYLVPIGKAGKVFEGSDVTLISYGAALRAVIEAAESMKTKGISCEVIDLRTIRPLDQEAILSSVEKTGRVIIIHEAPRSCGVGAEVSAIIAEKAILNLKAPILRVTGFDTVIPYAKLENYYIPDKTRVERAIEKLLSF